MTVVEQSLVAPFQTARMDGFVIVATTQLTDLAGRPQYLVGDHRSLPELIG